MFLMLRGIWHLLVLYVMPQLVAQSIAVYSSGCRFSSLTAWILKSSANNVAYHSFIASDNVLFCVVFSTTGTIRRGSGIVSKCKLNRIRLSGEFWLRLLTATPTERVSSPCLGISVGCITKLIALCMSSERLRYYLVELPPREKVICGFKIKDGRELQRRAVCYVADQCSLGPGARAEPKAGFTKAVVLLNCVCYCRFDDLPDVVEESGRSIWWWRGVVSFSYIGTVRNVHQYLSAFFSCKNLYRSRLIISLATERFTVPASAKTSLMTVALFLGA